MYWRTNETCLSFGEFFFLAILTKMDIFQHPTKNLWDFIVFLPLIVPQNCLDHDSNLKTKTPFISRIRNSWRWVVDSPIGTKRESCHTGTEHCVPRNEWDDVSGDSEEVSPAVLLETGSRDDCEGDRGVYEQGNHWRPKCRDWFLGGSKTFVQFIVDNWNDEAGEGRGNLHVGNCEQYSKAYARSKRQLRTGKKHL